MPESERTLVRLPADLIAKRRAVVEHMHLLGWSPSRIAQAILSNGKWAHLLSEQAEPTDTVRDDLQVLREDMRENLSQGFGLLDLAEYIRRQQALLQILWRDMLKLPVASPRRFQAAALIRDLSRDIARAQGVEVDSPSVKINWLQLLGQDNADIAGFIEGKVLASSGGGTVDALTFATHEDFCGLDLKDKPMEYLLLTDFARPGSGYSEFVDICGMRSGKGTVASILAWYKVYKLLELSNPQRYYGLAPGQTIGTYNMAMSLSQAKDNVFKHCLDRINYGGRWFQDLKAWCDANLGHSWQQTLQMTLPKNIQMNCGHSRAKSTVGGTNIVVLFDELCKFRTEEGEENAEDVYTKMKATTATFGEDALIGSLSSPEWEGDYGYGTLLKMAKETDDMPLEDRCEGCRPLAERPDYQPSPRKSHPRMMAVHMPSWEANTSLSFDQLWEQHNGAANPRAFWRDFGARPSSVTEGYYPNPERWDAQAIKDGRHGLRHPYDARGELAEWFKPDCEGRRFVHVDLALSRDSCGIAMAHKPVPGCPWYEMLNGEPNPDARKVVLEVVLQVKPQLAPGSRQAPEIDFDSVRQFIRDWQARKFRIKGGLVTYDGWQSIDSRQILRKEGFRTQEFSLDRNLEGHDTLQELLNTDAIAYYPHPVLLREAKQLQLKSGRKVDHVAKGSKDVVDAAAGAAYHALKSGGRRKFIGGSGR